MIIFSSDTNIGQRKVNEDSFFIDKKLGLYIVADGVGGLNKGEVASKLACETIQLGIKNGLTLIESVDSAHKKILSESALDENKKGMATTVVAVVFDGVHYDIAWVGDSRVYLWDGELKLITKDHSYVELLLENGHITFDQLNTHPDKNVIAQALGVNRDSITIATNQGTLEKDQVLLLATDGLFGVIEEKKMIIELNEITDIEKLTHSLVNMAVKMDGKDNITLLTLKSEFNSKNKEEIIIANVVRTFDPVTGVAEEAVNTQSLEDKSEQLTKQKNSPQVKSVKAATPRKLIDDHEIKTNNHLLETLLFVIPIILLLVLITLMM